MISLEQLRQLQDRKRTEVDVPLWGCSVLLQALSSDEKDRWDLHLLQVGEKQEGRVRAELVALSMVDEAGKRIIPDTEIDLLGSKSAEAVDLLYRECRKLNGMDGNPEAEKKS